MSDSIELVEDEPLAPAKAGSLQLRRELGGLAPLKFDDYIPSINSWMRFSSLFMVLGFFSAIVFMAVCPFRVVVRGPGSVRPAGELSVINSPFEGRLLKINVATNQAIEAGQSVVTLDQSDLRGKELELSQGLLQLERQSSSLKSQGKAEYEAAALEVDKNLAELTLAESEFRRFQKLVSTGATSAQQLDEREAAYFVAKANLAKSKKTLQEVKSRSANTAAQLSRELVAQLATAAKVKRDLNHTEVRSPVRGVIYRLDVRSPGQTISMGQPIATVAPREGRLIVKAVVPSEEIDNVKVGQPAVLKISGCPHPDFGVLRATVVSIAPDALAIEKSPEEPSGQLVPRFQGYEVRLKPEKTILKSTRRSCQVRIGMDLTADITTRNESMLVFVLRKARIMTGS